MGIYYTEKTRFNFEFSWYTILFLHMVERTLLLPRVGETPKIKSLEQPRIFSASETPRPQVTMAQVETSGAKSKTVKRKAPALWHDRAEFTRDTAEFFQRCGVDPGRVNPTPIGEGFYHVVFAYASPNGKEKVVKIPKAARRGYMSSGVSQDRENTEHIRKFFGGYAVASETRTDSKSGEYLFIQDKVKGKTVTSELETPAIRA